MRGAQHLLLPEMSVMACMMQGQPQIAVWSEGTPGAAGGALELPRQRDARYQA